MRVLAVVVDKDSAFIKTMKEAIEFHEGTDIVDINERLIILVNGIQLFESIIRMEVVEFTEELSDDFDLFFYFGGVK
jgi:hypothetical protein